MPYGNNKDADLLAFPRSKISAYSSWADQFESYLIANPEDRFPHNVAHIDGLHDFSQVFYSHAENACSTSFITAWLFNLYSWHRKLQNSDSNAFLVDSIARPFESQLKLKVDFHSVPYNQTFDFVTGQFMKILSPDCSWKLSITLNRLEYFDKMHTHWYWRHLVQEIAKWHLSSVEALPSAKFW